MGLNVDVSYDEYFHVLTDTRTRGEGRCGRER